MNSEARRLFRTALLFCVLVDLSSQPVEAESTLTVEAVRLPENAEVQFSVSAANAPKTTESALNERSDVAKSATANFRVFLDLNTISNLKDAFYRYDIYVINVSKPNHPVTKYLVQADPIGVFDDQWKEINFEITDGQIKETGTIRIPIHSFASKSNLMPDASSVSVQEVRLSHPTLIHIRLQNTFSDMGISVDPKADISTEQAGYWDGLKILPSFGRDKIHVDKNSTEGAFDVTLQPNLLQVLTASLPLLRDGQSHTDISVSVNYHADYGGWDRRKELRIPIRFVPSIWSLICSVMLGAVLGAFLASLLSNKPPKRITISKLLASCALGLIAEVIGMILVYNNSRLVLLGLELNPSQLLTALMIGVFSGAVVVWRSEAIQRLFDRLLDKQEAGGEHDSP
jgi:hypothetical protein